MLTGGGQGPASWRQKADAYLAKQQYQLASEAYAKAADGYDKTGDRNAGIVLREKSRRYGTEFELYTGAPATAAKLARGEPASGMYLGANIEREEAARNASTFNKLVEKNHAMFFMYRKYGVDFPVKLAQELKRENASLQIAWEPESLHHVNVDAYLTKFAKAIKDSEIPVFVRFASEMNGPWVRYHGDPALYKEKFRLLSTYVRNIAPNAIMVWSPNCMPEKPIPDYYPGADVVDWVGVNFYSVIYNDGDRARAADWRFPTDSLDFVYNRYSKDHPIMVSEWAASHRAAIDSFDKPEFAHQKMREFFRTVPLRYPRLKAASWLSFNALKYARGDRQLNNYSLFDNPDVIGVYKQEIGDSHFLSSVGESADLQWRKLIAGAKAKRGDSYRIFLRCYDPKATISADFGMGGPVNNLELGSTVTVLPQAKQAIFTIRDSGGRTVMTRKLDLSG
ncbi:MAG TPA: glycosyl hydrolase, partial [Fimbriimonas sp.]|nr:glycosyl hydrolase [Fimbriimonas sp.]